MAHTAVFQIVPLSQARLAQWAALRQLLWPHHDASAHLQDGIDMLANARQSAFLALDEHGQAVGFADAALRLELLALGQAAFADVRQP